MLLEGIDYAVDVGEAAWAAEGEGAGVGQDAAAEQKVPGEAAGCFHHVVEVGRLHQTGDGVDTFDRGEGGLRIGLVRPFQKEHLAQRQAQDPTLPEGA